MQLSAARNVSFPTVSCNAPNTFTRQDKERDQKTKQTSTRCAVPLARGVDTRASVGVRTAKDCATGSRLRKGTARVPTMTGEVLVLTANEPRRDMPFKVPLQSTTKHRASHKKMVVT
jgi:hypothetical protein